MVLLLLNSIYIPIFKFLKLYKYCITVLGLIFFLNGCSASSRYEEEKSGKKIRVLISEESDFSINVENEFYVKQDFRNVALVKRGNILQFTSNENNVILKINEISFISSSFSLVSKDNIIGIKGNKYKGEISVISNSGKVFVINKLDLEEYIKGVIPYEMPVNKEGYYESLKAFSICARTYALKRLNKNNSVFDIYSDVKDQVYSGLNSRNALSDKCVEETEGLILTYNGEPAEIYYFSSCGGFTEDGENVFTSGSLPYLRSIKDGTPAYCADAPKSIWTETFTTTELENRFCNASLINSNFSLQNLEIKSRFRSGRVNELICTFVNHGTGEIKNISLFGNKIRYILKDHKNSILKSNFFNIRIKDSLYLFDGKGYGHGVGLCQWGALNQSLAGKNYRTILNHYFPGTKILSYND